MSTVTDVILLVGSCWLVSLPVRLALELRRRRRRGAFLRRYLAQMPRYKAEMEAYVRGELEWPGLYHPGGGWIRPSASTPTKSGSARTRERSRGSSGGTTRRTRLHAAGSSSSTGHGLVLVSEGWETPRMLRDPSRLTERGWSTPMTVIRGGNGLPPGTAG